MNQENLFYQIALSRIPQIGVVNARRLVAYFKTVEAIFAASVADLQKIPQIGPVIAKSIRNEVIFKEAEEILEGSRRAGISILFYQDEAYPDRLKQIYDAPLILYFKGNGNLNHDRLMAVVGTRKATDYGKRTAQSLISASIHSDVHFVSGLAYGIDIEVHKQAIEHGIPNYAVLAGGFQFIYPAKHKRYLDAMMEQGGILAEYPLFQKPDPRFFPLRNRIIAGMTDATLVVEAAEKGGALITADYANNYHREVFAVPGNVAKLFSEGCNTLIQKHKAVIYTDWANVCIQMNWVDAGDQLKPSISLARNRFTEDETVIVSLLVRAGESHLDTIAWKIQKSVTETAVALINLEFQGIIKVLPGYMYRLK